MTTLFPIPENHRQRFSLHNEVHARSPITLNLPVRASHLTLLLSTEEKKHECSHLASLCERFGIMPPKKDADHFSARLGMFQIRWEQHDEFSNYTFYVQNVLPDPFAEPALTQVPVDWLNNLPGSIMVAAHASILPAPETIDLEILAKHFAGNSIIGAEMTGGAANAFTDFRIHVDGFSRFLILDKGLKPEQAGRLIQRLFEIEVYRVLALRAFPIAKKLSLELNKADKDLYTITSAMSQPDSNDAELLDELTTLAAAVENHISSTHFRFDGASAYYKLVTQRIKDLREVRIQGIQTIGEFMKRRLEPAIYTCQSTANRFALLSERISNASQLLRTRVDIAIERQNQDLLSSMNRRAKIQLRLQETVEGLSIVAITTYVTSLIHSIVKALKEAGFDIKPDLIAGLSIPVVILFVALSVRRIHKMIQKNDTE